MSVPFLFQTLRDFSNVRKHEIELEKLPLGKIRRYGSTIMIQEMGAVCGTHEFLVILCLLSKANSMNSSFFLLNFPTKT